ncbi:G-protein coupled receptor 139 [Biomphalaria glabrata]|nr:putative G-protein coupled receptor 139 [Biomphalaria glabrata]KAI8775820.1 G-protein coupled receptor 139 [Biomphalaria glabrata]
MKNFTTTSLETEEIDKKFIFFTRLTLLSGSLILLVFGIPGNLLTVVVLYRRSLKDRNLHFFLASLCCFNIVVLCVRVPRFLMEYVLEKDVSQFNMTACMYLLWLDLTLVSITTWHVTFITVCRVVYVLCRPRNFSSQKCSVVAILLLCTLCSMVNATLIQKGLVVFTNNGTHSLCELDAGTWQFWFESTVNAFLPMALLLMCDVSLCLLSLYLRSRTSNFGLTARGLSKRLLPVVFMSTLLIIVTSLPIRMVENFKEKFFRTQAETNLYNTMARILLFMNHTVNYFLYCFVEKRLRSQVRLLFFPCRDCCCLCLGEVPPDLKNSSRGPVSLSALSPDSSETFSKREECLRKNKSNILDNTPDGDC